MLPVMTPVLNPTLSIALFLQSWTIPGKLLQLPWLPRSCVTKSLNLRGVSPYASPIFEIYAGPHRKRFLAHSGVLCKSESLRALVEGRWKDSLERRISWEEWDEDSVARFLEWLYTGDYSWPYPTNMEPLTPTTGPSNHEVESSNGLSSGTISKPPTEGSVPAVDGTKSTEPVFDGLKGFVVEPSPNRSSKQKHPRRSHSSQIRPLTPIGSFDYEVPKNPIKSTQEKKYDLWNLHSTRSSPQLDYETTLLAHAKLYTMASCFLLGELKNLALQQLQICLIALDNPSPESPVASNITALIQYVYANTVRLKKKEEPMRKLVTTYVASQFTALRGNDFMQLLVEGGDIVDDVLTKLRRRIASYEVETDSQKKNFASEWDIKALK